MYGFLGGKQRLAASLQATGRGQTKSPPPKKNMMHAQYLIAIAIKIQDSYFLGAQDVEKWRPSGDRGGGVAGGGGGGGGGDESSA